VIEDIIPLNESKQPIYHASRVQNCIFHVLSFNCDVTALWLQGAVAR
jgi:hypothetical protein